MKDKDLNVLQKYCYNYKGQTIDCDDNSSSSVVLYKSAAQSGSFTKNNCAEGGSGSTVSYSLGAGAVTSTVSQADADALGLAKFNTDGQNYANSNGSCTFYSVAQSGSFTKNDCAAGGSGSNVSYSQGAGVVSSTVSQADADALGYSKFITDGQAYANANGYCTFYSVAQSGSFTKNDCAAGGVGSNVSYSQAAGIVSSTVSQADADALGYSKFIADGQVYANANGYCTFYSAAQSGSFTKNDCAAGGSGSNVSYSQGAGAVTSIVSQAEADALGYSRFIADGQVYANANGYCTFYSAAQSGSFTKNDCAAGGSGSNVSYSQAAGVQTSTTSQADADALGYSKFITDGQAYANANGYCTFYSAAQSGSFTKNDCAVGGAGSNVSYSQGAGAVTSTVSQADADALGYSRFIADGQVYANVNGYCTFYSAAQSGSFTKNDCAAGGSGSSVSYSQGIGAVTSTISQADADAYGYSKFIADGQVYANSNANCTFWNSAKSRLFSRNNCAEGGAPGSVWYTVAAGLYSSTDSQVAADAQADYDVNNNGQAYANANATCTFWNTAQSGLFTRNNCAVGGSPSSVWYSVAAGIYSSTDSQVAADSQALSYVNNNGQAYANANGSCTFYNAPVSRVFFRNNCPANTDPGTYTYSVPYGEFVSNFSQSHADNQAQDAINTFGQQWANMQATCTFFSAAQSATFTRNNCGVNYIGGSVVYSVPYGARLSTISQADADNLALMVLLNNGQANANAIGSCTFIPPPVRFDYEYYFNTSTRKLSISTSASTTAHNGATLTFEITFVRTSGATATRSETVVYARGEADKVTEISLVGSIVNVTSVTLTNMVRY
ncbi:DUF5977 domain-containing protein [Flavobacterium sp.]|uniref:DUF5977 domain-containing protein n=1 Tax=Flavobacterium sp. TaxID=239 RepID=UPI002EDA55D3